MNFWEIQIQFVLRVSKEKVKICTQSLRFLTMPLTLVHSRGKMKYSTIFLLPQWHRSSVRTKNYECPLEARDTTTLLLLQKLEENKQIVLFRQRLALVTDSSSLEIVNSVLCCCHCRPFQLLLRGRRQKCTYLIKRFEAVAYVVAFIVP